MVSVGTLKMSKAVESSVVPFFCDELVTQILLKLPPKARFRCTCVCKHWQDLISDPSFIQEVKSLPPISHGFFYSDSTEDDGDGRVKYYCTSNNKIYHNVSPPKDHLTMPFFVQASHSGLLLCREELEARQRRQPRQFVCNPYTKEWVYLPRNPHIKEWDADVDYDRFHVLFCYEKQDSYVVEFKVLSFYIYEDSLQLHIYSSETGEWTISQLYKEATFLWIWRHLFLSLHDVCYVWDEYSSEAHVCDFNTGSIRRLTLPEPYYVPENTSSQYLGMSAGSVYYTKTSKASIRIWLHHEGDRWSLEHIVSFEDVPILKTDCFFGVIGFHPMKLVLLMESDDPDHFAKKNVMYDVNRREIQLIPAFSHGYYIVPYLLPSWLPRLKNSRSSKPRVWRSLLSLHEEKDAIKEDEDPTNYEEDLDFV